jgi:hypothetical protein
LVTFLSENAERNVDTENNHYEQGKRNQSVSFSLTIDLVEGLLDLPLAPIAVDVHSQHQSLRTQEQKPSPEPQNETPAGLQTQAKLPWRGNGSKNKKNGRLG